jgi:hypothetical protein
MFQAFKGCSESPDINLFVLNEILLLMNSFYESYMLDSDSLFKKINELISLTEGENLVMVLSSLKKIIHSNLNNDSHIIR